MKIVSVIPLKKGIFKDNLSYFSTKDIAPGSVVNVNIRDKKILALAVSVEDIETQKTDIKKLKYNLKKILDVKEHSIFSPELFETIISTANYFLAKKNNTMVALLPAIIRENYDKIIRFKNIELENDNKNSVIKNIKNEKLLFQLKFEDRISYYKTLIRGSFAQKKSVFIVAPTEKDINEFTKALEKGIENFVVPIHGGFSPKKQLKKIEYILTTKHPLLIIGTAQYIAIERDDIETIILEKESSNAYKMFTKPYVDLRTFIEIYASKKGKKLIIGDFLLRLETIARREFDNFGEVYPLSYRTNFRGEIKIPENTESFKIITDQCAKEIQAALFRKENIFIFTLRKGLSTITICNDCKETLYCENCSAPLVLYISKNGNKRMYVCNKCKEQKDSSIVCQKCGSWNLIPLGIGIDTVVNELNNIFPNTKIFKLDKESAKNNTGAEKIINDFSSGHGSILVGTEMSFYYLKEKVPLSVIASFDSLWSIPNFKMGERIIQLMISILDKTEKKLIIQTKNQNDYAIKSVLNENILSFVREELKDRKNLGYPPYSRFIKVTYTGDKEKKIFAENYLKEIFKNYNTSIYSGYISKIKNEYSTNALLKIDPKKWSLLELTAGSKMDVNLNEILNEISSQFEIIVDPEDLI